MLSNNRMNSKQTFNTTIITDIYDRCSKYECDNVKGYKQHLKENPNMVELIGAYGQQIKPVFDVDAYNEDIDISSVIAKINGLFPGKNVYYAKREPREYKKHGMKYSYRFYVDGVRINYKTLKTLLTDNGFDKIKMYDMSIYEKNKVLFLPLTTQKEKGCEVPELKLCNTADVFKCCASYIQEDFEDWDLKFPEDTPKVEIKFNKEFEDTEETKYDGNLNFTEIITKLKKERATEYNPWFYVGVALINLYHRKIFTRGQLMDIYDLFSAKSVDYSPDGVVKMLDINIPRFNGKGYGIKYLLDCLKEDDEEYYKSITFKDMIIDGSNDDIGASQIVIEYYKGLLTICKGVLYVNYEDIWINNQVQVDKILIDMIGKLDIMFYGADGKRKYHYNKSIKHIKDCIVCIKANQSIINDNFYDDMIKNNKYYLPFKDCIYSFLDKKTYTYGELPNIHFTYKINRYFPKFNKTDYDDLMNKVIIPIYPDEEEQRYNAHIKARALAGCYHDKKWYGYGGSRNSGKGTETGLLRSAFQDFVMEFNAKCLIFNKFGNPEPAKALSWVVDKKDARIIISNEIDGNEDTKLNGAFIKTLASGGDAMEGRRLYENTQSFIPQFTMFLCYNKFYEVVPNDATENLEQFEYKSKFVSQEELIPNISYLKLKDEHIKEFIKEDRIIDAYTLYILNAFSNPRMNIPKNIKNSTEINKGEKEMTDEQFIMSYFITTNDDKDRMHTETIKDILNDKGYKLSIHETGRLMNRIGFGKYNSKCNVKGVRKGGFDYLKYVGKEDEI
jgi:hypothetical protein